MKTLILVRHAKSDWGQTGLDDFERPLNERGKKDAPVMAKRLKNKSIVIDAIVASPAKRAAKTATVFAEELGIKKGNIFFKDELYLPSAELFFSVIENVDDSLNNIVIFSHNNGITDFANLLTDTRIDNIPTCGVFAVKIHCKSWKELRMAKKDFWFFDYPKSNQ